MDAEDEVWLRLYNEKVIIKHIAARWLCEEARRTGNKKGYHRLKPVGRGKALEIKKGEKVMAAARDNAEEGSQQKVENGDRRLPTALEKESDSASQPLSLAYRSHSPLLFLSPSPRLHYRSFIVSPPPHTHHTNTHYLSHFIPFCFFFSIPRHRLTTRQWSVPCIFLSFRPTSARAAPRAVPT